MRHRPLKVFNGFFFQVLHLKEFMRIQTQSGKINGIDLLWNIVIKMLRSSHHLLISSSISIEYLYYLLNGVERTSARMIVKDFLKVSFRKFNK
jgi:hypothetical protein